VKGGSDLTGLARKIDEALAAIGCKREERPYAPHITLARITPAQNRGQDIRALREHIASMTNFDFGSFEAEYFHLYLSKRTGAGSEYSKISSYPLVPAA